jgi:hypothetical protein
MGQYIGTKIVHAFPHQQAGKDGYAMHYADGYTSWSPKDVFEEAYRRSDGMNFGLAIEALKKGARVARAGWNGKGMWLAYSPGAKDLPAGKFWAGPNRDYAGSREDGCADVLPCITMKTATGEILMGWLASQTDMLADDWQIVE